RLGVLAVLAICWIQQTPAQAQSPSPRSQSTHHWSTAASGFSAFQPDAVTAEHSEPDDILAANRIELTQAVAGGSEEHWQLAPVGLLYKSYLASPKESRISTVWMSDTKRGLLW